MGRINKGEEVRRQCMVIKRVQVLRVSTTGLGGISLPMEGAPEPGAVFYGMPQLVT